jgi:hypothetical protein
MASPSGWQSIDLTPGQLGTMKADPLMLPAC